MKKHTPEYRVGSGSSGGGSVRSFIRKRHAGHLFLHPEFTGGVSCLSFEQSGKVIGGLKL